MTDTEKASLRRRDFWAGLVIIGLALFFLWRTSLLPFFQASAAGVQAEWFSSAALVPYFVFAVLFLLGLTLLAIAIREGGSPLAGTVALPGIPGPTVVRVGAIAVILLSYIFALVPRVDFVVSSALILTAMIAGFHEARLRPALIGATAVAAAGLYALIVHFPRAEWNAPHDDDWVTLGLFVVLTLALILERRQAVGRVGPITAAAPVIGVVVPLLLVSAMAFGFRQNVPNRGGLIFSQVEYHYYVTLRPWLRGEQG
ncbi:MAG: hypothetical protein AAF577_17685 [Pseudomonadota bacterium]